MARSYTYIFSVCIRTYPFLPLKNIYGKESGGGGGGVSPANLLCPISPPFPNPFTLYSPLLQICLFFSSLYGGSQWRLIAARRHNSIGWTEKGRIPAKVFFIFCLPCFGFWPQITGAKKGERLFKYLIQKPLPDCAIPPKKKGRRRLIPHYNAHKMRQREWQLRVAYFAGNSSS